MINICTLFYSNYLTRGIALYESLKKNCYAFCLYVLAFDDKANEILLKMNLPDITVIKLSDFEDEELLKVKPGRETGEYCWTCTPSLLMYVIKKYKLKDCTYVDADLYFFSDPGILIEELGEQSVSIIEHRYSSEIKINWAPRIILHDVMEKNIFSVISEEEEKTLLMYYKKGKEYILENIKLKEEESKILSEILFKAGYNLFSDFGKYCVQFMTFKNDEKGMNVLNKWREDCLNWCYAKVEDGKFGDQKYLDTWINDHEGVKELQNPGGGVAPWNIGRYDIKNEDGKIYGIEKENGKKFNLIFFHFAALRFFDVIYSFNDITLYKTKRIQYANEDFGNFPKNVIEFIYKPYIKHLQKLKKQIEKIDKTFDPNGNYKQYKFLENIFLKQKKRK